MVCALPSRESRRRWFLGEEEFSVEGQWRAERSLREDSSIFLCAHLKALRSDCSGPDNFSIKRK